VILRCVCVRVLAGKQDPGAKAEAGGTAAAGQEDEHGVPHADIAMEASTSRHRIWLVASLRRR